MSRARGPWELPRSLLIGGHAAFLGQAYEAAPLRRAVRLWLPPCRSRAGSFRFDRPSGLRCRALPRASDTASSPSLLETGRASLAASGHHIGALPEAAMVRLSSVAWALGHIADDRLSARVDVDMFDHHFLPSATPHVRQRIHLGCECPL